MEPKNWTYRMSGMTSSGGDASLSINFKDEKSSKNEGEMALAIELEKITQFMFDKGYIQMMSPSDLSKRYGKTRQYWEKLIKEGKIPYQRTASGAITTNIWVEGYLRNKEEVDKYANALRKISAAISEVHTGNDNTREIKLTCPYCKNLAFEYCYNRGGEVSGSCRTPTCDFRINTII